MVTRLGLKLLLSFWLTSAAYAQFTVELDKTQSRLGEPVMLRIGSSVPLATLDLTPITRDFDIFSQTTHSSVSAGLERYALEATLYPLRSGRLMLPGLSLGTARSRSVAVQILPGNVSLIAWVPPEIPMEREPTLLHLEVRDDGSLTWDTPIEVNVTSATLQVLPELGRQETQADTTQFVHHYRWRVLPLKEGSLKVNFGMVDAHKLGQRLRFPVNAVSLRVQAAPAYLPLHLPIGKPLIHTEPFPTLLIAGRPTAWNMVIQAPGLSAEGALRLLQYTAPQGLRFYAPSVTPVNIDGMESLRLTLSFVAERTADTFPALHLPYFDRHTRRIEVLSLPATRLNVRDPWHQNMLTGAWLLLGALVLAGVAYQLWPRFRQLQMKRAWLSRIRDAADATGLYHALTQAAPWRSKTLRQCPEPLQREPVLCAQLEQGRFGHGIPDGTFTGLKQAFTNVAARIPLRFFNARPHAHSAIPTWTGLAALPKKP